MKITKRELKRIIAEEYAAVYGKPQRKTSKRTVSRKVMLERKRRKREIMIEAQAAIAVEEMLQEGMFSQFLSGIGGALFGDGGIGDKIGAVKDKVAAAIEDASNDVTTAFKTARENAKNDEQKKALELVEKDALQAGGKAAVAWAKQSIADLIKTGYEKEEAKALLSVALTNFQKGVTVNGDEMIAKSS